MIDLIAALGIIGAAAQTENAFQLIEDGKLVFAAYQQSKAGKFNPKTMPPADLKALIKSIGRLGNVASKLSDDPQQLNNIANLIVSLGDEHGH